MHRELASPLIYMARYYIREGFARVDSRFPPLLRESAGLTWDAPQSAIFLHCLPTSLGNSFPAPCAEIQPLHIRAVALARPHYFELISIH